MNTKTVKKSETATIVAKAMKLLASAFSEPYEAVDRNTGEVSIKNSLGFWQDGVMGAVCYALANKLEYTRVTTMPKAKESVEIAIRSHKGDELSEVVLQRAVSWVQRLMEQEATAEAALFEAKREYYVALGKAHQFRGRESANRDIVETPAMAAAKALGIGVQNVAAGYGSAEPQTTQRSELPSTGQAIIKADRMATAAAKQKRQRSAASKAAKAEWQRADRAKMRAQRLADIAKEAAE